MNSNESNDAPLRDVAQSPEATARYLADVQRLLLDVGKHLETLAIETRVHCRGTHVDGDRWYHARLRALPVEKALKDVLKHVNGLTEGLEKTAYKRNAFADEVKKLPAIRREKELEKQRKKAPQIQAAPENPQQPGVQSRNVGYSEPTSIYDLGNRESA
ncbi:hypothetical protein [Streptomyces sp. NBC_00474]|uniref:hypothetical protein n=1 Tax=Streptomyces sp. NBC_00474 TaxID=2975754 RepID=UPI00224E31AF|nr:hypothetical protein [Streptomyces sp. NBC_00474]MCX5055090.1 hypothetical protein [Streptomyces sp. NBC_00474]